MVFIVEARHRVVGLRLKPRLRDPPGGERLEDRKTSTTGEAVTSAVMKTVLRRATGR